MVSELFNPAYLRDGAKWFWTLVEFDSRALVTKMLFHFFVSELLLASLADELYVIERLEEKSVDFWRGDVRVATVWTIF